MIVKTKKYQLDPQVYIKLAMTNVLKEQWWVWLIPVAIMLIPLAWNEAFWWCFGISLTAIIIYLLFWGVQFAGATQVEQNKPLFQRMSYEIDSRQIMMKLNAKQGMPIKWEQIQKVKKGKDDFVLIISKGHLIHWPFSIFRNDHERGFAETIMRRKGLLPEKQQDAQAKK